MKLGRNIGVGGASPLTYLLQNFNTVIETVNRIAEITGLLFHDFEAGPESLETDPQHKTRAYRRNSREHRKSKRHDQTGFHIQFHTLSHPFLGDRWIYETRAGQKLNAITHAP